MSKSTFASLTEEEKSRCMVEKGCTVDRGCVFGVTCNKSVRVHSHIRLKRKHLGRLLSYWQICPKHFSANRTDLLGQDVHCAQFCCWSKEQLLPAVSKWTNNAPITTPHLESTTPTDRSDGPRCNLQSIPRGCWRSKGQLSWS